MPSPPPPPPPPSPHRPAARPPHPQPVPHTNTVRLKASDLQKLHEELEAVKSNGHRDRKWIRLDYLQMAVRVEVYQSGGTFSSLRYASRNLSSEGLGILHNAYVHPGVRCVAYLRHRDGREVPVEAFAVRCRHVKGLIHEVGLRFKAPINIRDFLTIDPMDGTFTIERVDPKRLNGTLLHVDESAMDRKQLQHFLADTKLKVVSVGSGAAALELKEERVDIVIVDNDLAGMPGGGGGIELVEALRARGLVAPVVMFNSDASSVSKQAARGARVNAIIRKPMTKSVMLQALAEFLISDSKDVADAGSAVVTTLDPRDGTFKFVAEFVEELKRFAEKITKAITAGDAAAARRICYQLKGAAPALGFSVIGQAANAAMVSLDAHNAIADSAKELRQLVGLCLRAKVRNEAEVRKAG